MENSGDIKKPVENVLEQTLRNLRDLIDVDCIVGEPIIQSDITIIPISKVSVGFISGGGEYENIKKKKRFLSYPFAGGSGGGCNISPIGFLVVRKDKIDFIKISHENNIEKVIDIVNNFVKSCK